MCASLADAHCPAKSSKDLLGTVTEIHIVLVGFVFLQKTFSFKDLSDFDSLILKIAWSDFILIIKNTCNTFCYESAAATQTLSCTTSDVSAFWRCCVICRGCCSLFMQNELGSHPFDSFHWGAAREGKEVVFLFLLFVYIPDKKISAQTLIVGFIPCKWEWSSSKRIIFM